MNKKSIFNNLLINYCKFILKLGLTIIETLVEVKCSTINTNIFINF